MIWEFRIVEGKGEVIDPYAPMNRAAKTAIELRLTICALCSEPANY